MNDILKEQGLKQSGIISDDYIVKVGRLIGVQQIVAGNIGKIGNLYIINLRLIDVETGEIVNTATEDCKCSIKTVAIKSIKYAAYELAGLKVDTTMNIDFDTSKNNLNTEWDKLGISKDEYIKLYRIGFSKEKIEKYIYYGFNTTDLIKLKKSKLSEYFWLDYKNSGLTVNQYIHKLESGNSMDWGDIILPVAIVSILVAVVINISGN